MSPKLESSVKGARCDKLAIRRPVDTEDLVSMAREVARHGARVDVPKLHGGVLGAGDEHPAVGRPCELVDGRHVGAEGREELACVAVPELDALVKGAARDETPVGRERHGHHLLLVPCHAGNRLCRQSGSP